MYDIRRGGQRLINPLVAYYDIHGGTERERSILFFYFERLKKEEEETRKTGRATYIFVVLKRIKNL
jgi:hypothetical protein